ncbi:MAG: nitroreductase family deazaflavin-dependent oxidoreductase [Candidatus Sulfotelmatobacter sp.]|jgi:deazaflavin-dependent oxidoreductase (nitroreductase family)
MEKSTDTLKGRLARYRQITITVIGRKSGKKRSRPVWFVLEGETLYLLPVEGAKTQWFLNLKKDPTIAVDARGTRAELRAKIITNTESVKSVVEKFREKYGADDVKKYYSGFDVAATVKLG